MRQTVDTYLPQVMVILQQVPDAKQRAALAKDPRAGFEEAFLLGYTNPAEVLENPALPLLALENPERYEELVKHCEFMSFAHTWYCLLDKAQERLDWETSEQARKTKKGKTK